MKGYKVFNPDWTCRGKQYTCPGEFSEDYTREELAVCNCGIHFCKNIADCFSYYDFSPKNKVAEVVAIGDVKTDDDKSCTNHIRIIKELSWNEVLNMVNSGNYNTGNRNSGDRNSGNRNSGGWNTTNYSTGCFNTMECTINMFDMDSGMTYSEWFRSNARYIMTLSPAPLKWISQDNMTDEEKEHHPEYKTTGGYLRKREAGEMQKWWDSLSKEDKETVMALPNFDPDIFKKCTEIDVRTKE